MAARRSIGVWTVELLLSSSIDRIAAIFSKSVVPLFNIFFYHQSATLSLTRGHLGLLYYTTIVWRSDGDEKGKYKLHV